jgi:ABC-2 type transport system permease protein
MLAIYQLSLRQLSGRWRIAIMTVLAALPVLMAVMMLHDQRTLSVGEFDAAVLSAILAGSISPLVVLAIAGAAFANETEDRTLANLTLSPLPRWQIVVPKLVAAITISGVFIAVSAFATSHIAFIADSTATIAVTVSAIVGVAMYAAFFVWLGLVTPHAIGFGLLYVVLWEGLISGFVSGVRLLSIRHYAAAWMHGLDSRRFAATTDLPTFPAAIAVAAVVVAGFTFLAVRRLRRMDVP